MVNPPDPVSRFVSIDTPLQKPLRLHYLTAGSGPPIVFLHGWPTSAYLWRQVMPHVSDRHQVIALDLPGFGRSDKPLDTRYNFRFYSNTLNGFLNALGLKQVGLVVHDLGGPVGIYWAQENLSRLSSLAILNTLVYPQLSWAVKLFMASTYMPVVKQWLTSHTGFKATLKLGIYNGHRITPALVEAYQQPFVTEEARAALLLSAQGLSPKGFATMAARLPEIKVPVHLIYGENDRLLPDVARTMARLQCDIPQAELTSFPDCGHFLQEDEPAKLGRVLSGFFRGNTG